jgi:hypothetical protein
MVDYQKKIEARLTLTDYTILEIKRVLINKIQKPKGKLEIIFIILKEYDFNLSRLDSCINYANDSTSTNSVQ